MFSACFSHVICVQYGRFTCMKCTCNAAMPVACTVLLLCVVSHNTFSQTNNRVQTLLCDITDEKVTEPTASFWQSSIAIKQSKTGIYLLWICVVPSLNVRKCLQFHRHV